MQLFEEVCRVKTTQTSSTNVTQNVVMSAEEVWLCHEKSFATFPSAIMCKLAAVLLIWSERETQFWP